MRRGRGLWVVWVKRLDVPMYSRHPKKTRNFISSFLLSHPCAPVDSTDMSSKICRSHPEQT